MLDFFASAFGYLLNFLYNMVGNYGYAIIIFTILVKLIMLPISVKQQKTMKKTAKVQVKLRELQEKYGNDQVRLGQETMDLYKKENMSPFSGCLGSIVQMILILSVFFLVSRPLTFMRNVDPTLIETYTKQVQEQDPNASRYPEIGIIKLMGDKDEKVKINMDFLGLDLSDVPTQNYTDWKVYIIPGLYVITSIVSTKLTTAMNNKRKAENEEKSEPVKTKEVKPNDKDKDLQVTKTNDNQELDTMDEVNRQMNIMMPLMSVSIALIAPLGLALYWFVSNLLMIVERLILDKVCKEEE
ncbi:MAG: YidC/Oxa1 family membrane protein insertase [Clostridia bacterium]|nr:YidC/Oxa1 family membrane protein insertase [Clostridia bacterium]